MGRFVLLCILLSVNGCRSRPTQLDPFLGKTTVPPPPTGSVGSQAPVGAAYPAAPPTAPTWGAPPTVPATSPGAVPGALPTGAAPSIPFPPPQTLSGSTTPPPNTTPYQFTGGGSAIRVVPPDPNVRSSFGTSNGGVDIMQLPVKGQGAAPASTNGNSAAVPGASPAAAGYGFDPAYSQLSGRLEYSSLDGRWLLRYMPPQSKPDRFGGVVVLVPGGSMAGFNNGDFVTAQGRLDAAGSASPVFTATALSPQRVSR